MRSDFKILLLFAAGFFLVAVSFTFAGNISGDPKEHWAWNDDIGWIDFGWAPGDVTVNATSLSGYASTTGNVTTENVLSLNCDFFSVCGNSNYRVLKNEVSGDLSGWAWHDRFGWFSFNCSDLPGSFCTATSNYKVYIDGNGDFHGWAWNDVLGWTSFNCGDLPGDFCNSTSSYKVKTTSETYPGPGGEGYTGSLESSTFDTGFSNGVSFNSIAWKGTLPGSPGGAVKFRFASSNCSNGATNPPTCNSGGWGQGSGVGAFLGSDCTTNTFYGPVNPNSPAALNKTCHNNHRYYRYQIFLKPSDNLTESPQVTDVVINYSP